jgi:hypothetical protein
VTATTPGQRFLPVGLPRQTAGSRRVDTARSQASFAARAAGRRASAAGRPGGHADPIEDSTVQLAADLRLDDPQPGGPPRLEVASSLVIDSQWVTRQRIPALGRHIVMTCSLSLEPDM